MDTSTICLSVFAALVSVAAIYRIYSMRAIRTQVASYRSQIICPSCGFITARYKANCLHCGKPMHAA